MNAEIVSYKPSAWYFRQALLQAETEEELREVGFLVVAELEHLKAQLRAHGIIPTKRFVALAEAQAKGWCRDPLPPGVAAFPPPSGHRIPPP